MLSSVGGRSRLASNATVDLRYVPVNTAEVQENTPVD